MSKRDNLYLVGLMGAGKTTVGRLLAKHYGCAFHDSDHEIEARTGVKIPVIFARCCKRRTRWNACASSINSAIPCIAKWPTSWWIPGGRAWRAWPACSSASWTC